MVGGPFHAGACVRVLYDPQSYDAYSIGMVNNERCSQEASQQLVGLAQQTPDAYSARLTAMPGISGTWVISGVNFVSTPETRLITWNGPLVPGAWARVYYRQESGVNMADEIRIEKLYRCFSMGSFNLAYSYLVMSPDDLVGAWVISNIASTSLTFMTIQATQVYTNRFQLETDACIKFKYFNEADPDIDIPDGIQNGEAVWVNAYQESDGMYATQVVVNNPVLLPMIKQ